MRSASVIPMRGQRCALRAAKCRIWGCLSIILQTQTNALGIRRSLCGITDMRFTAKNCLEIIRTFQGNPTKNCAKQREDERQHLFATGSSQRSQRRLDCPPSVILVHFAGVDKTSDNAAAVTKQIATKRFLIFINNSSFVNEKWLNLHKTLCRVDCCYE